MPVAEKFFVWCRENKVNVGSRVEWDDHNGYSPLPAGSGVVELIWFGMEETLNVQMDDGTKLSLFPAEGIHHVRLAAVTPPGDTE